MSRDLSCSGVLDVERVKTLYRDLMCVFDKLVLPTHASCHVQFCIFYLCSFRLVSGPRSSRAHSWVYIYPAYSVYTVFVSDVLRR